MKPPVVTETFHRLAAFYKKNWRRNTLVIIGLAASGALLLFNGGADRETSPASPLYFFDAFIKFIAVLLLIFGGAVVLRRWQGTRSSAASTRRLAVVETVRLSQRQALHLVHAGNQCFLVGATDHHISLISTVDAPSQGVSSTAAAEFAEMLQAVQSGEPVLVSSSSGQP